MEAPVIIAIVTATASCVVGVISLVSARSISTRNATVTLELEQLRFELEQKRKAAQIKFELRMAQLITIGRVITIMQDAKELFQIAQQMNIDKTVDINFIRNRHQELRSELSWLYISENTNLKGNAKKITHDFKHLYLYSNHTIFVLFTRKYENQQIEMLTELRRKFDELQSGLNVERERLEEEHFEEI
ncbi:hypothetical protein [Chitinophaga sp. Cy-1792]|uniref:hypothetical protein n=1 Tax=Chitinophaga sp. Cy-1792 TaxID=2608339 RepID=UPI00141DC4B7|nr:hypothetical protein [Chitinophaga sp. Cy-1792]NIG56774.1 hypothetical protein [Chitinophaga sp. Cy-1792]